MSDSQPPFVTLPPVPPPPPTPVPSAPSRGVSGWLIAVLVLLGTAGASVLLLIVVGLVEWERHASPHGHGRVSANMLHEVLIEDNGAKDKVAVIDVSGVITGGAGTRNGTTSDDVRDQFDRVLEDEHVKAVVLRVESPGGEVLASDEIYQIIRTVQMSNDIPVVASMGSLAASGGYYVSAPCRWIVAHQLTLTGSIGVIFHGYNYRGLMDKVGVLPDVVKSGKLKDMFSGEQRPEDVLPEEKAILKELVAESFGRFKQVVREGRRWAAEQNEADQIKEGRKLSPEWESIADGRILSGTQALQVGLVDELGDFDQAVARAMQFAGLESANLISYESPPQWSELVNLLGKSSTDKVRIELPGLSPSASLPQGRLYFVSPLHMR